MTSLMKEIDVAYRAVSGLSDRRYYKIFYSHIHPFPLIVLGYNPGGESDGTDLVASESFFENWEHDYLCFRDHPNFPMAGPMCRLLATALQTSSVDVLRQVPATNVIFRRSRNTKALNTNPKKAAEEAAPFLRRILLAVNPTAILLVAKTAYDLFTQVHCRNVVENSKSRIFTPNGRYSACIYLSARAYVLGLERTVPLFMLGHPSTYASRSEWLRATKLVRRGLHKSGFAPIAGNRALINLTSIDSYGTSL